MINLFLFSLVLIKKSELGVDGAIRLRLDT